MRAAELDLDLDVFAGPFDLLMTVVLREEIALAEVELGEIVIAYLERVEERGELDLEAATEFLVLIASLLELKSRLLLPAPEEEEIDLGPEEAAEELLARMLEYRRYRDAAAHLAELFAEGRDYLYRSAPLPPELRRVALDAARPSYDPELLAVSIGDLLRVPPAPDTSHIRPDGLARAPAAAAARAARRRARDRLRQSFGDQDKLTQAVTLFALLELHKRGEATWEQGEVFGRSDRRQLSRERPDEGSLEQVVEALLFLSPEPVSTAELAEACEATEAEIDRALDLLGAALEGRGVVLREVAGGHTLAAHPDAADAARRLLAPPEDAAAHPGAGRDAGDRRLPAAGVAAGDRAHPRRLLGVRASRR